MHYLLDTNIISDLIKNPDGKAAGQIRTLAPNMVCTSVIVAGELRYGAAKKASAKLSRRVEQLLGELPILPLDGDCADVYGRIRAGLERKGLPVGANDLWIAAHALAENMTLVTHNAQEFARIEKLKTEDWLN